MVVNRFTLGIPVERARAGLDAVRVANGVPEAFPDRVLAEARQAADSYRLPELDLTSLELVTLDPASSTDLDQAFLIERAGSGYRVHYAIADVPAFVRLGGAVDTDTRQRGATVYCPDTRVSLHPPLLCEDVVSLLPGQVRGAYVWTFDLAPDGAARLQALRRASIRSRAKLAYDAEQARLDAGDPHPQVALLREVGQVRLEQEVTRGAVSLPTAAQEVRAVGPDSFVLAYHEPLPIEAWNAQLSLMTGMAAATVMLDGGIGVLRTMPPPTPKELGRVRSSARGLGIAWPRDQGYPDLIRSLDPRDPRHLAFLDNVTTLLRGAGYTAFDGTRPELSSHSAIAGEYAHATAPLRRLVDRFVLATCAALVDGRDVDPGIRAALAELPGLMASSSQRARAVQRESLDYLEAELLAGREGAAFRAVVIEQRRDDGIVQLADPAITARCRGRDLPVGEWVDAWLAVADPTTRTVVFDVLPRSARRARPG